MRKILFILDNLEGGGAERVFVNIANGFVENNIQVEFLLGQKRGIYFGILNPGIPVIEAGGTTMMKYLATFPGIFKQNNYTHIFTASHYAGAAAIIAKKISRIPAKIYFTHHFAFPEKRNLVDLKGDLVLKFIHFFITPHADRIIAVSKGSLQWLRKFSHHKLAQATYIYNPVFDNRIYGMADEPVDFPVDIKDKIVLLNAGRLATQKDQLTLIKAFGIFRQIHPEAILFILGDGPLQSMLEKYVSDNKLSASVFFMGFQQNPYKWMARSDVFVLSSIFEGFGNVLVEAMALGKTVVSTRCIAGPDEILENGKYGYLCPVGNVGEMAKAISNAVAAPFHNTILREHSQKFTIANIVKEYIEIL